MTLPYTVFLPSTEFIVQININEFLQIQKAYTTEKYVPI